MVLERDDEYLTRTRVALTRLTASNGVLEKLMSDDDDGWD